MTEPEPKPADALESMAGDLQRLDLPKGTIVNFVKIDAQGEPEQMLAPINGKIVRLETGKQGYFFMPGQRIDGRADMPGVAITSQIGLSCALSGAAITFLFTPSAACIG